eukprot:CAMPEP_0179970726 /NCGR_PEP_ID=MMETSP0983-20121128/35496_1 /TAXON_ID=483367 /ORGANISM="non described non described, Strain CCMP 2436" /LENGTH=49 /DNA_ID=CAMNT_0021885499 /DNA_START=1 /DNA_END=150 /DNA_ORIENTATION=+
MDFRRMERRANGTQANGEVMRVERKMSVQKTGCGRRERKRKNRLREFDD